MGWVTWDSHMGWSHGTVTWDGSHGMVTWDGHMGWVKWEGSHWMVTHLSKHGCQSEVSISFKTGGYTKCVIYKYQTKYGKHLARKCDFLRYLSAVAAFLYLYITHFVYPPVLNVILSSAWLIIAPMFRKICDHPI